MKKVTQRISAFAIMLIALGAGAVLAGQALAQGVDIPLDEGTYRGVPWLSGGVGESSREQLMKRYGDYNLKLEFAVQEGNYLADIAVNIATEEGAPVLRTYSTGPWLMTKLPAGAYDVTVSGFGETFAKTVTVPAEGVETLVFNQWTKAGVDAATPAAGY